MFNLKKVASFQRCAWKKNLFLRIHQFNEDCVLNCFPSAILAEEVHKPPELAAISKVRYQKTSEGSKRPWSELTEPDRYFTLSLIGYGDIICCGIYVMKTVRKNKMTDEDSLYFPHGMESSLLLFTHAGCTGIFRLMKVTQGIHLRSEIIHGVEVCSEAI